MDSYDARAICKSINKVADEIHSLRVDVEKHFKEKPAQSPPERYDDLGDALKYTE